MIKLGNMMKKQAFLLMILLGGNAAFAGSVEQYIASVEKSNQNYQKQLRQFLKGLDAQQTTFSHSQQSKFCGMMQNHVDELYRAVEQNRDIFPMTKQHTKQDVITEVTGKMEWKSLQKYGVQCDLT